MACDAWLQGRWPLHLLDDDRRADIFDMMQSYRVGFGLGAPPDEHLAARPAEGSVKYPFKRNFILSPPVGGNPDVIDQLDVVLSHALLPDLRKPIDQRYTFLGGQ